MKFHSIRIQNYKSINDITLYLSDVNLLIGPNNSGKSNILSALKLFSDYIYFLNKNEYPSDSEFVKGITYLSGDQYGEIYAPINFTVRFIGDNLPFYILNIYIEPDFDYDRHEIRHSFVISKSIEFSNLADIFENSVYVEFDGLSMENYQSLFSFSPSKLFNKTVNIFNGSNQNTNQAFLFRNALISNFSDSSIYNVQVEKLKSPARLTTNEDSVFPDGSNIVSFIDSMRDTNPKIIREIEKDLFRFTKEFESIRLIKVPNNINLDATFKKLGLADKDDNTFWSDQLSEGVLYFLALLAIIHQPNPPHLFMLEEPEKGVHPRRIKEIIELIFQIAKDKNIRIILTTHSPFVVDEFADVPEGVHIVDKIDKSTQVKNLKRDFIDKEEGKEDKIDYLSSLGEHWSIGFLGGVPE